MFNLALHMQKPGNSCSLVDLVDLVDSTGLTASQDGSVQVYNTHQMSKLATLKGHRR